MSVKDKEIIFLKINVTLLAQDLEKLTRGRENLNKVLGNRKIRVQSTGLGYNKDKASDVNNDIKAAKNKEKVKDHASSSNTTQTSLRSHPLNML